MGHDLRGSVCGSAPSPHPSPRKRGEGVAKPDLQMKVLSLRVRGDVMTKKINRRQADDLLESLKEARDHFAGKRTGAVVHRAVSSPAAARRALMKLGLQQRPRRA
jgi:hypothetical protein